jgi:hypothetical protein
LPNARLHVTASLPIFADILPNRHHMKAEAAAVHMAIAASLIIADI